MTIEELNEMSFPDRGQYLGHIANAMLYPVNGWSPEQLPVLMEETLWVGNPETGAFIASDSVLEFGVGPGVTYYSVSTDEIQP